MRSAIRLCMSLSVLLLCFAIALSGSPARATTPACSVAEMQTFVNAHSWPMTISSTMMKTLTGSTATYCDVVAYLVTAGEGADKGLAGIEMGLPASGN